MDEFGKKKKIFYQKIKPFMDEGLVRIVYSGMAVTILACGEICYVACMHDLWDDCAVGIYGTESILKKVVITERYIYPLLKEALSDLKKHRGSVYFFREDKLDSFKKWVAENQAKGITAIDSKLEKKIGGWKGLEPLMKFNSLTFEQLTPTQVYEILRSRCEVFMLEQRIICLDMDGVDYQSRHCFLEEGSRVVAYLRAFYADSETVQIGRVLTLCHGLGHGRLLMERTLCALREAMPCKRIRLHSQSHAIGFYEKFGFKVVSEEFMEEGVPHVTMERECI